MALIDSFRRAQGRKTTKYSLILTMALLFLLALSPSFLSVIHATNAVPTTISTGSTPDGVAYDSGRGEIFTVTGGDTVSVISDGSDTVVATIPVGHVVLGQSAVNIAYDSGKGEIFVTNSQDRTVSVISDASDKVVSTIPVGIAPIGLTYDSDKGEVFVANYGDNTVSVISDASTAKPPLPT